MIVLTKTASISSSLTFLTRGFHTLAGACQNSSKAPVSLFGFDLGDGEDSDEEDEEDWNFLRKLSKFFLYSGGAAG